MLTFAVARSHFSEIAIKSPNEDIRSAPRARAYAVANGVNWSYKSSTWHNFASSRFNGTATAAPAGDTCSKNQTPVRIQPYNVNYSLTY